MAQGGRAGPQERGLPHGAGGLWASGTSRTLPTGPASENAGYGLGVAVADYDNDGLPDIYLSNFGANVLYQNNGDGTFSDVAQKSGTAAADPKVGAGAAFLDIDGDGELDLFVANYLQFAWEKHGTRLWNGVPAYTAARSSTRSAPACSSQ